MEQSTLVYTLLDNCIPWDDFVLIIKDLHRFAVISFKPIPKMKTINVKVGYNASIKNARIKLGANLLSKICVAKINPLIKESDIPRVEALRRQYGFGITDPSEFGTQALPVYTQTQQQAFQPVYQQHQQRGPVRHARKNRLFNLPSVQPYQAPTRKHSTSQQESFESITSSPENTQTYTEDITEGEEFVLPNGNYTEDELQVNE